MHYTALRCSTFAAVVQTSAEDKILLKIILSCSATNIIMSFVKTLKSHDNTHLRPTVQCRLIAQHKLPCKTIDCLWGFTMRSCSDCDSGGTLLTVNGDYLDSVAEPKLTITGVIYTGGSRLNNSVEFESSVNKPPSECVNIKTH